MNHAITTTQFFNENLSQTLESLESHLRQMRKMNPSKKHAPLTSAAVKRTKVAFISRYLDKSDLDLTITSSAKIFKAILNRSVSQQNKARFATAGRTATDKTELDDVQIAALADLIKPALAFLLEEIEGIKYKVATEHRKDKDKKVN